MMRYENRDYNLLPKKDSSYMGRIYGIEYGDYLKIGSSSNVRNRINGLQCQARYGGVILRTIVVSPPHTNYKQNEKELQMLFTEKRVKKTELFKISLEDFVSVMCKLNLLNDSKELKESSIKTACFIADYFRLS